MGVAEPEIIGGRYALFDEIASGGMASVHYATVVGPGRFSRVVAVKRLHAHLADEHELVAMFVDEARLAARIRHPNVVPTLDVVTTDRELFLVLEYVHGESLSRLLKPLHKAGECLPPRVACAIAVGALHGLHAAHEAVDEHGDSLHIVHRDVSPQNILVGTDGVPRVVDFGIAHANDRLQTSAVGQIKGKCMYMAPEYITGKKVTRAADLYSAGVVLWEALTGRRLFTGDAETQILGEVLYAYVAPPSRYAQGIPPELDALVLRALDRDPEVRFDTARSMVRAIEAAVPIATATEVGDWVEALAGTVLAERARTIARIESSWATTQTGSYPRRWLHALAGRRRGVGARDPSRIRSTASSETGLEVFDRKSAVPPSPRKAPVARRRSRVVLGFALAAVIGGVAAPVALRLLHRSPPWHGVALRWLEPPADVQVPSPSPATTSAAASSPPPSETAPLPGAPPPAATPVPPPASARAQAGPPETPNALEPQPRAKGRRRGR
ncbi:MAG: serine/threonine-protein kinase [Polyangiaceae bacterium]